MILGCAHHERCISFQFMTVALRLELYRVATAWRQPEIDRGRLTAPRCDSSVTVTLCNGVIGF